MSLTFVPSRYLPFQGDSHHRRTSYFNLINNSKKAVAFKVMTNNSHNKKIGCQPNKGVIGVKKEQSVKVTLCPFKDGIEQRQYKIQVHSMEVNSEWVNVDEIWKNVQPGTVSEHELLVCFVDENSEPQNVGRKFELAAPVLNFAPKPSSVHLFGGVILDTAPKVRKVKKAHRTAAKGWEQNPGPGADNVWTATAPSTGQGIKSVAWDPQTLADKPVENNWIQQATCWEQPVKANAWAQPGTTEAPQSWDQNPAQAADWNSVPTTGQEDNNADWGQPQADQPLTQQVNDAWGEQQAQATEWGQPPNVDWNSPAVDQNGDQNAWGDPNVQVADVAAADWNTDGNQVVQAYDQNQDWAAAAAGDQVVTKRNLDLEAEILAASFKVWRETVLYAIGFFILGLLLGKAGF